MNDMKTFEMDKQTHTHALDKRTLVRSHAHKNKLFIFES